MPANSIVTVAHAGFICCWNAAWGKGSIPLPPPFFGLVGGIPTLFSAKWGQFECDKKDVALLKSLKAMCDRVATRGKWNCVQYTLKYVHVGHLCCITVSMCCPCPDGFGFFINPLEDEFGWTRTQTNLGFSLALTLSSVFGLLLGTILDRVQSSCKCVPSVSCVQGDVAATAAV